MSKTTAAARADANTIAADTAASPQSQLAVMAGTVPSINPQGDTARFVLADIKGKDAAVSYRLSVIRTAVLELLKGNPRNLKEAAALVGSMTTAGKAKAYSAGFAVLADVAALERTGKWLDKDNADLRTQADTLADAYTAQFASAYATVLDGAKAKAAATRAANKAAKEQAASATSASATPAEQAGEQGEDSTVQMDVAALVDTLTLAIQQGMVTPDELTMLRLALAASDAIDTRIDHLLTSTPALLSAQAH